MNAIKTSLWMLAAVWSVPIFAEKSPTCVWLYLEADVRVYQCAVLPEEPSEELVTVGTLPDPTLPLGKQSVYRSTPAKTVAKRVPKNDPAGYEQSAESGDSITHQAPSERTMVLAIGDIDTTKALLRVWDDTDFYELKNSQRLSLGVYSTPEGAERRQQSLRAKGIPTELVAVTNKQNVVRESKPPASENVPEFVAVSATHQPIPKATIRSLGYIVTAVGKPVHVVRELQRLQIKDYLLLTSEPYRDRVSLGVFKGYKGALRRQQQLKSLGIDSEMISRNDGLTIRSTVTSEPVEKDYKLKQLAQTSTEI